MPVLNFGLIIQKRREMLGISQEDLADGICSVPTLSRIENGTRMPTKNNFEVLLQRLGYSDAVSDHFVDKQDFQLHNLKYDIRQAYIAHNLQKCKELLDEFKGLIKNPTNIDEQFVILYDVIINLNKYSNKQVIDLLEKAIRLTYPNFNTESVSFLLSYEELTILNNIAVSYAIDEQIKKAIDIFYNLKKFYDLHVVNIEEALRTKLMVLTNLIQALDIAGRYDECIEIADEVIKACKETARVRWLAKAELIKAQVLYKKFGDKHLDTITQLIKDAYCSAYILNDAEEISLIKEFINSDLKDFNLSFDINF